MRHPIHREPIFYVADPSHVVKKLRRSLQELNGRRVHKTIKITKPDGSVEEKDCLISLTLMRRLNDLMNRGNIYIYCHGNI